jgi:hypothetical protein
MPIQCNVNPKKRNRGPKIFNCLKGYSRILRCSCIFSFVKRKTMNLCMPKLGYNINPGSISRHVKKLALMNGISTNENAYLGLGRKKFLLEKS